MAEKQQKRIQKFDCIQETCYIIQYIVVFK